MEQVRWIYIFSYFIERKDIKIILSSTQPHSMVWWCSCWWCCATVLSCYACDVTYIQCCQLSDQICVCARFVLFIHTILSFFFRYSKRNKNKKKMVILLCISACFIRCIRILYLYIWASAWVYVFKKRYDKEFCSYRQIYIVSIVFGADVFQQASSTSFGSRLFLCINFGRMNRIKRLWNDD